MSSILIVGAGRLQVPLIETARRLGHRVVVADRDPAAPGVRLADAFEPVSTLDADGLAGAARRHGVSTITTTATDQPLVPIARALRACGLPGMDEETALRCTRKDLMRAALAAAGVPIPESVAVSDRIGLDQAWERIGSPMIVKPADSSGSRGVSLVSGRDELRDAYRHASENSRCGRLVAESFLEGREFSVETLTIDGSLQVLQVTEKSTSGPPHFVESGHFQPADLTPAERESIVEITRSAARALGIGQGPTHTEAMLTQTGPFIIEVGARPGGDYITSDLVPLSTGIDMLALVIELSLGRPATIPAAAGRASAIRYFRPPIGRVTAVDGVEECSRLDGVVRIELFTGPGETIVPVTGSHERAGYVITAADDAATAVGRAEECLERIVFRMA